jgi:hypothetical protein
MGDSYVAAGELMNECLMFLAANVAKWNAIKAHKATLETPTAPVRTADGGGAAAGGKRPGLPFMADDGALTPSGVPGARSLWVADPTLEQDPFFGSAVDNPALPSPVRYRATYRQLMDLCQAIGTSYSALDVGQFAMLPGVGALWLGAEGELVAADDDDDEDARADGRAPA